MSATTASAAATKSSRQRAAENGEIEALATSLHVRLNSDAVFHAPSRDLLFRFEKTRVRKPPAFVPPPAIVQSAPVCGRHARSILSLSGVASDVVESRRTLRMRPNGVIEIVPRRIARLYTVARTAKSTLEWTG